MEIVAMDMKVSGMYIARQLSFSGVSFRVEEIRLDSDFKLVYNKAAILVSADCLRAYGIALRDGEEVTNRARVLRAVGGGVAGVHACGQRAGPGEQEVPVGAVLVVPPALLQIPLHRRQGPLPGGARPERSAGRKGQRDTTQHR